MRLYRAYSTLERFTFGDEVFADVGVCWFTQRNGFPGAPDDLLQSCDGYSLGALQELFTQDEIGQLRAWLREHGGPELSVEQVRLPLPATAAGQMARCFSPNREGFLKLDTGLPFKVGGFFTLMEWDEVEQDFVRKRPIGDEHEIPF